MFHSTKTRIDSRTSRHRYSKPLLTTKTPLFTSGKTYTVARLVRVLLDNFQRQKKKFSILCACDTNVAVDNMLENLTEVGVKALRVGQTVKIREDLRNLSLDFAIQNHPLGKTVSQLKFELDQLLKKGGRGSLEAQQLSNRMRVFEKKIFDEIMEYNDVICATCIGSGHDTLKDRNFPVVIIDGKNFFFDGHVTIVECTQAIEPASLCPIVRGAEQVILLGDHYQLPPTVISQRSKDGTHKKKRHHP